MAGATTLLLMALIAFFLVKRGLAGDRLRGLGLFH